MIIRPYGDVVIRGVIGCVMVVAMVGCVPLPPDDFNAKAQGREGAMTFVSPLAVEAFRSPLLLPLVVSAPNKLGLAGGNSAQAAELGASWVYQWVPQCNAGDVECVPMIWGRNDITATVSSGTWLMGFNEPDLGGQSNLLPVEAAALWREIECRWPHKRLVAPAPSHENPYWIEGFFSAYVSAYGRAPRLDALAFHCYFQNASQCIELGRRFVGLAEAWGVDEVWCTEFAFVPAYSADAASEAVKFATWLEQQPRITRYAPFVAHITCDWSWPDCRPSADPSLFDGAGRLTEIGGWYARSVW